MKMCPESPKSEGPFKVAQLQIADSWNGAFQHTKQRQKEA